MDFFNSITSFFEVLFNFLSNLVSSLVLLVQVVMNAATLPVHFLGVVMPFLGASMVAVVGLGILFKVLGR